jgi:membrane protease YdiL (CAAX protease family)
MDEHKKFSPSTRRTVRVLLLVGGIILTGGLVWVGLRVVILAPWMSGAARLILLVAIALACLSGGLLALRSALRRQTQLKELNLPVWAVLTLAYFIPFLAFQLPDWMAYFHTNTFQPSLLFSTATLNVGQPWYFLWQMLVLAGAAAASWRRWVAMLWPPSWLHVWSGLAAGMGLWLGNSFIISLLSAGYTTPPGAPGMDLRTATIWLGILLAPLAEEIFFRGRLRLEWGGRWGWLAAGLTYGLLQGHPLLWLPGILTGLGLSELTRRTGSLLPATIAHILYNAGMLLLGWNLVL